MHDIPIDGELCPPRPGAAGGAPSSSPTRVRKTSSDASTASALVDGLPVLSPMQIGRPAWYLKASAKRRAREALIPAAWRLPQALLEALPSDVRPIPASCGLLTTAELAVTEEDDAAALIARMASGELQAVNVCRAYCKRAAIAQQVVRPRLTARAGSPGMLRHLTATTNPTDALPCRLTASPRLLLMRL